ncbi:HAD family hydrolase [Microbulbifer sp. TRSA005]|uniref:HAD family hydrolase n=1 Tax=Microbulbifer sp. TRSA005 TaxID=3243383 RepID=UPI00403A109F
MAFSQRKLTFFCLLLLINIFFSSTGVSADLPSWNNTSTKSAIVSFVKKVTQEGSFDFVPPELRIAVFDNDGTLWAEKPAYVQLLFAIDEIKRLAPEHPKWQKEQPFASILKEDFHSLLTLGKADRLKIISTTQTGMTDTEFNKVVNSWLTVAKNPLTGKPYRNMVYQPMHELLKYLRANGFKTYISSGGGVDFIRALSMSFYGIPPEQVIGSRFKLRYEDDDGHPQIITTDKLDFVNDGVGKPIGISQVIGFRPIFVAGNSDGDLQMLEWSTSGKGPRFGMLVHHTDSKREWSYDSGSNVGHLDKALKAAKLYGWTVVDMAKDWAVVFPQSKITTPEKEISETPVEDGG